MVRPADVRAIALALLGAVDDSTEEHLAFSVAGRGFAWTYLVRTTPKGPRLPNPDVLAVSCPLERKEMLIAAAPAIYFDDDHYRGYPAVLVRLPAVAKREIAGLIADAFQIQAAKPVKRKTAKKKAPVKAKTAKSR